MMKQLDGSKAAMLTEVAIQDDETFKPEGGFVPETEGLQGQELYNIDEAVDICLRMATKNDLDEIFNLIQVVGKEMDCKNPFLLDVEIYPLLRLFLFLCVLKY